MTLSWKDHIADLTSKLNKACYAIRTIKPFMTFNVLRTVYFFYFHSVMSYGIIFWGNSHLSTNIFKIQKRIIRIITNKGKRDSCRQLFKTIQILPSQAKPSQAKVLTGGGDLREAQVDVPLSVSHSCV